MKKTIYIAGCDLGSLARGQRAKILDNSGRWLLTSPVCDYIVAGGVVLVETENTVYRTA